MIEIALRWPRATRRVTRAARRLGFGRVFVRRGGTADYVSRPFAGNLLTSDPDRYARSAAIVETHPQLGLGAPTIAWGRRGAACHRRVRPIRAIRRRSASRCW